MEDDALLAPAGEFDHGDARILRPDDQVVDDRLGEIFLSLQTIFNYYVFTKSRFYLGARTLNVLSTEPLASMMKRMSMTQPVFFKNGDIF